MKKQSTTKVQRIATDVRDVTLSILVVTLALWLSDIARKESNLGASATIFVFALLVQITATFSKIKYLSRTSSVLTIAASGDLYQALKTKYILPRKIAKLTEEEKKTKWA